MLTPVISASSSTFFFSSVCSAQRAKTRDEYSWTKTAVSRTQSGKTRTRLLDLFRFADFVRRQEFDKRLPLCQLLHAAQFLRKLHHKLQRIASQCATRTFKYDSSKHRRSCKLRHEHTGEYGEDSQSVNLDEIFVNMRREQLDLLARQLRSRRQSCSICTRFSVAAAVERRLLTFAVHFGQHSGVQLFELRVPLLHAANHESNKRR